MSSVHYTALRSAWNRVNVQKIINEIILNCSSFKIGKTGDTLDDRLSNGAYIDNFGKESLKEKISFTKITRSQAERLKVYLDRY